MYWFSAFVTANLIGIGSSFDNSGAGLAYGANRVRIPHYVNVIANLVGCAVALIGALAGTWVRGYVAAATCAWASCLALSGIGIVILYLAYIRPLLMPGRTDAALPAPDWRQGIILGLALSFTNLVSGFGSTVSNACPIWASVASITLWGYLMIWLGNIIGIGAVAHLLGKYASLFSGLLLIAVGFHQVYGL